MSRSVFSNARGLIVSTFAYLRCLADSIIAAVRKVSESMKDLLRATALWGVQLKLSKCLQEIEALCHEPRAVFLPRRGLHSIAFPELHLDDCCNC